MRSVANHWSSRDSESVAYGKRGYLSLGFSLAEDGRSVMHHWERRAPLIVQQELYFDHEMPLLPCVYILSAGGPMLYGDRFEQHFSVEKGAMAHISTGSATKVAEMEHDYALVESFFRIEEGGYMEYLPEPTIPCRGSRFRNFSHVEIAPSATLVVAECYLAGRKYYGEIFEFKEIIHSVRATRKDGELLFAERMVIEGQSLGSESEGIMGGFEIMASVVVLTPKEMADKIYNSVTPCYEQDVAMGISRLPNECGLQFKVLGRRSEDVKLKIREFCSAVRLCIKQRPLPEPFRWR